MLEFLQDLFINHGAGTVMAFLPALIGGAAALGGATIGAISGASEEAKAREEHAKAIKMWMDVNIPNPEDQKLYLEQMKQQGVLTPEMEQSILQGESEMAGIQLDPRLRQAQLSALGELQNIGEGGIRLGDQASMDQMLSQVATDQRGRQEAIQQGMARRGVGGSGMELGAKLASQQAASQQAGQMGLNQAAMAQDRALQAIMQGGQLGGQMRGQDFGQAAQIAQAQDAINRFNTGNMQDVQRRNVASGNRAQELDLREKQRIADANVGISNFQQQYNNELLQREYENKLKQMAGATDQYAGAAAAAEKAGQASRDQWTKAGGGAGKIFTSALDSSPQKARLLTGKKDMSYSPKEHDELVKKERDDEWWK